MPSRLCIFCRALEPADQPCPKLRTAPSWKPLADPSNAIAGPSPEDESLLVSLRKQPGCLCRRCSAYDIPRVFAEAEPLEPGETHAVSPDKHRLDFGKLSSLQLEPTCPFCRLLYAIFPRDLDPDDELYAVVPFRSYVREPGWNAVPPENKDRCAIFLGFDRLSMSWFTFRSGIGDHEVYKGMMCSAAIALEGQEGRVNNARMLGKEIDVAALRASLEDCQERHGDACRPYRLGNVRPARMVDVRARKVVPCPPTCDYAALSYVWGDVHPEDGALESGALPQTIEDATTVTKELGLQYLWVDALCIDQTRNPTPDQLASKNEQLRIMDLIYAGATITLVALIGTSSASGIPGVSKNFPRTSQMCEEIEGVGMLFTVPPHWTLALEASRWNTRAWTLQESMLSKRIVYFCQEQCQFLCPRGNFSEGMDLETPVLMDLHPAASFLRLLLGDASDDGEAEVPTHGGRFESFAALLENYTKRQMTNDSDSLNAILGILSAFTRGLFPSGFIHGLPLWSHPYSLGWMHTDSVTPRRRPEFPSWSWAGWEGIVRFPDRLLFEPSSDAYPKSDLEPEVVAHEGNKLTLKAWVVDLEVVTEPFSEVRVPGEQGTTGFVTERNFSHPTRLPSGMYSCLVAQRVRHGDGGDGRCKQLVVLVVLNWDTGGAVASRRTLITFESKIDLMRFGAERREMTLL
ncbi:related to tol protein [Cephalotrichum gorgonifer]|uniref:Related to tol protein n=1 Tax=Cephalotrichum gorgonifer TaxID=2041049 RepID=A0AAE8MUG6_9PEZI|nr:related to tol protein [Cephalotrichum gorgonifer]